jgi:amino acid adenylation domain-containing protein/FkbM family methyltransferase
MIMAQPLSLDSETSGASKHLSLVGLLRERAILQADSPLYTFLIDGEEEGTTLSYLEVDQQARAIGALLQSLEARGERALLVYPPGLEFVVAFYGCLYAGVIAVPTHITASQFKDKQSLLRFQAIVEDASPFAVLTLSTVLPKLKPLVEGISGLSAARWIATDSIPIQTADSWNEPEVSGDDLAFLQYTSGSTAYPKGVMVSHRNLLANLEYIDYGFEQTPQSLSLTWLPHFHDMGLINGFLQPLYKDFRCFVMSPAAFLQSPFRWLKAISRYRITHSGGPNFAYDLCLRKITEEQRATLDLSCWAVAFNGAEPIRRHTLEAFAEGFAPCGFKLSAFYPAYGLAEATLKVTGGRKNSAPVFFTADASALEKNLAVEATGEAADARSVVGSGEAACGTHIVIANPKSRTRCASNEVGEVWVSGPGVTRGYWNRPKENEEIFRAHLDDTGEGPFLRTGDLGFIRNGELFITGRIKDLIIIRGLNHYPQDIELTVERSHPALRRGGGAAFSIDAEGEERLVVVHELDFRQQPPHFQEIVDSIRQAVAENHQVQLYALALIKPGVLPKTTSGKVQRSLCRSLYLENTLDTVTHWQAPPTPLSEAADVPVAPAQTPEAITEWLRSLLAGKIGIAPSSIDVTQPVTIYGVDSLTAIELGHHIQTAFGIVLSVSDLLASLSLSEVTARLLERLNAATGLPNLSLGAQEGEFPLSSGQQALWFLYVIAPQSIAYNIATAARVRSEIDVEALRRTFQILVDRHAMLRTTFTDSRGEPFQHVHKHCEPSFDVERASEWSDVSLRDRLAEEATCAFDLEKGPLFKVKLFSRASDDHVLLLVVHHIVADMWSLALLLHEVGVLYSAEKNARPPALEPLTYQYTDYVRWESEMLAGAEGERLKSYWQKQLADAQTVLDLPSDRPRSKMQSFRGDSVRFSFDSRLVGKLRQVGQERGATLYTTLLAAFQTLLYRYTEKTDFLVGSPTSGRSRTETAEIVGYFVNPVVLRADFSGAPSFNEILRRVRQTVFDALDHDGYPFPLLVKQLQPERDPSRSPLFQVFFALQKPQLLVQEGLAPFVMGTEGARIKLGDLTLESMSLKQQASQFDLSLTMTEMEGELIGSLDYNTDLFDQATIQRMAGHIQILTESLIASPEETVSRLPLLTEAERQLMAEWAHTSVDYRRSEILPELFEQQARRTREEIALVFEDQKLTYDELNRRANKLAHWLQAQGVGADTVVGVLLERSVEMVVGLLGILKAGAAYMPLDPAYPQDRLSFMVNDARSRLILTERRFSDFAALDGTEVFCLDSDWEMLSGQSEDDPARSISPDNLAYVIYTSGSTGKPKGVMNTHRAISNRLCWMQAAYDLNPHDRVLQKTPFTFDVSVWEFFWPLIVGARLVVARPGGHQDSAYLATLISEQEITTLHFVPSMLQAFLDNPRVANCRSLQRVICSGEALSAELQQRFFSLVDSELHNLYGPTEAAVDVTFWACEKESDRPFVPIGRAIANIQIHIVDTNLQPVPVGVPGELQIAGIGLARGYVNRPDLTAEKFIPDPFSSEPGARMYRTGDLTRFRAGGEVEFLGRIDHQVKVRGFRIELGEIEAALISHPAVREAVVIAKESQTGDKRLVAYVVPHQEQQAALQAFTDAGAQSSSASAPEARREDAERRHKLPNGLVIAHDGDIQFNTMDIYREVFEKEVYLKHGVTLSDGDCVFDVGAHIGLFTLFVNEKCRDARVYAFEPIPPTFKVLRANVSIPGLSVKLFNLGLADRPGMDRFNYYPRMTGVSGRVADPEEHKRRRKPILSDWLQSVTGGRPATMLSERDLNDVLEEYFKCETYDCRLTTLSEVIRENNVERIDLLKIDVEESELDVLAGIRDEDWAKIKQIVLEVESREGLDAIVPMLQERGYEVFVDSVGYGFSSEGDAGQETKSGSTGYMIYSLRPQASEDQATEKRVEAASKVLNAPPDSPLSVENLRNHLLAKLPDYMTPSAFVLLDRMPLLSNGKVDRKALPAPEQSRRETEQGYVAPRNEVEQALAEILAEVLGLSKIGVHDDFFKFGGHSLLATQVMSRILEKFQVELPLQQLFEQPTVAGFAESVMNAGGFRPEAISPITKVNQSAEELLLARIDQLTDEEVEALLGEVAAQDRREE